MMVIAKVFRKIQTLKNFVGQLCKKRRFGTRFDSQHVKVSQILAKSPWFRLYQMFPSFWERFIRKMSPLLLGEVFGTFLNKVTVEGKHPIENWENLHLTIQIQLSENPTTFSELSVSFIESTWNFKHFGQKRWSS